MAMAIEPLIAAAIIDAILYLGARCERVDQRYMQMDDDDGIISKAGRAKEAARSLAICYQMYMDVHGEICSTVIGRGVWAGLLREAQRELGTELVDDEELAHHERAGLVAAYEREQAEAQYRQIAPVRYRMHSDSLALLRLETSMDADEQHRA